MNKDQQSKKETGKSKAINNQLKPEEIDKIKSDGLEELLSKPLNEITVNELDDLGLILMTPDQARVMIAKQIEDGMNLLFRSSFQHATKDGKGFIELPLLRQFMDIIVNNVKGAPDADETK